MKKALLNLTWMVMLSMLAFANVTMGQSVQVKSVVVTFSPLIINNLNCTDKLFEAISGVFAKNTEIAQELEASGALWSVSQNLSGIQICINSSKDFEEINSTINKILSCALERSKTVFTQTPTKNKPINRLYQFFIEAEAPAFKDRQVSLTFYDDSGNEICVIDKPYIIEQTQEENPSPIEKYCQLYKQALSTNDYRPIIQKVEKPILAKLLFWKNLNLSNYMSANLIKNRLVLSGESPAQNDVEIITTGKGLVLVVLGETDGNNDYKTYLNMTKTLNAASTGIGTLEWQSWSSKLIEVMQNDLRDNIKFSMFDAWVKHWQATDFYTIPKSVKFKEPDFEREIELYPSLKEHTFKLSTNSFPAIYACKTEDYREGAYVAVCFDGHPKIIEGIEAHVSSNLKISTPITIAEKGPNRVILFFYCQSKLVPVHLSKLKSSITGLLHRKFRVNDLKKSMRIGIAGVSSIPAYKLGGLLSSGWTTNTARYKPKAASKKELYELIKADSSDSEILKKRWTSLSSVPKYKASILSYLACHNLTIDSWEQ